MRPWWLARWRAAQGLDHEYRFVGWEDLEQSRIQLQLNLFHLGYVLPNDYTLERTEGGGWQWNYPILVVAAQ